MDPDWLKSKLLNCGDVLHAALRLYVHRLRDIVLTVSVVMIPWHFLTAWFDTAMAGLPPDVRNPRMELFSIVLTYFGFLVQIIVILALSLIAEKAVRGEPFTYRDALRGAYARWSAGITTGLLGYMIIMGLTLMLVVPGLIGSVYLGFMFQAVILRDKVNVEALAYSKSLVDRRWWNCFFVIYGITLVILLATFAVAVPMDALPVPFISNFMSSIFQEYIFALNALAVTIFFLNLELIQKAEPEAAGPAGSESEV